jgi:hypothetical protein
MFCQFCGRSNSRVVHPSAPNNLQPPNLPVDRALLRDTLAALWIAWWQTRVTGRRTDVGLLLPPVQPRQSCSAADTLHVLDRVNRIVRVLVFWKFSKRCYYRSFAAASVLRRRGVDVHLHFGLQLEGHRRKRCHCWITIGGNPVGEPSDPHQDFPLPAGDWAGVVHYWLADGPNQPGPAAESRPLMG